MHGAPDMGQPLFDVECIVVHMAVSCVPCRVERSHIFILADVVAECIVNGLHSAEHDRARCIAMAVIILIVRSVAVIRIPRLSVAVSVRSVHCIEAFVILEYSILAFPRPDARSDAPRAHALVLSRRLSGRCIQHRLKICIIRCIDLLCSAFRNVILHDRPVQIHGRDRIPAYIAQIVVLDQDIG